MKQNQAFKPFSPWVFVVAALMLWSVLAVSVQAQETSAVAPEAENKNIFTTLVRAADSTTLLTSDRRSIHLWGIEGVNMPDPVLNLRARTALDDKIGSEAVECEWKSRSGNKYFAQCVNSEDDDLSLYMLQNGYAVADRAVIYNTVFENAYIQAENQAKDLGHGVWSEQSSGGSGTGFQNNNMWVFSLGFALFTVIVGAFTFLSIKIMRGFQKVIDAQNDNVQMMSRERKLRDKERSIVAVMLDSELKANKSKIEAYIVVYEEMMRGLKDPIRTPKYKKAGDIIQRQPALDRSVFDRNTDKIDVLGRRLASELIHFFARIKTNPEYTNVEPDANIEDVIQMVEESLEGARRLNKLADHLLESFSSVGMSSESPEDV
jgi:endonuclease YncB( thermonuclease family)